MSTDNIVAIVVAVFACQGIWQFLLEIWRSKSSKRSNDQKLLMGIAYKQIVELCDHYIRAGEIEAVEYKELNQYLFEPYKSLGGNGTAARLVAEVEKLPIKKEGK